MDDNHDFFQFDLEGNDALDAIISDALKENVPELSSDFDKKVILRIAAVPPSKSRSIFYTDRRWSNVLWVIIPSILCLILFLSVIQQYHNSYSNFEKTVTLYILLIGSILIFFTAFLVATKYFSLCLIPKSKNHYDPAYEVLLGHKSEEP